MGLYMLVILCLSLFTKDIDRSLKIKVFDVYNNELYKDSLFFYDGTILSSCKYENSKWIMPNNEGIYEFQTSCESFGIRNNKENYSSIEFSGLSQFKTDQVLFDSIPIYQYYGTEKVTTSISYKKRLRVFGRKWKEEINTSIRHYGDMQGLNEKNVPKEIEIIANEMVISLKRVEFIVHEISSSGKNSKGQEFRKRTISNKFDAFYSNEF